MFFINITTVVVIVIIIIIKNVDNILSVLRGWVGGYVCFSVS